MIYEHKGLKVHYSLALDGCGTWMGPPIIEGIKKAGRKYKRAFEWCAGPGFVGLTALVEGVCEEIVLADRHPGVKEWIEKTRAANPDLAFTYYESDNFKSIPDHEMFDLVIGNPPNYYNLNPEHPSYQAMKDDHRPNDPGWKIHEAFYLTVGKHLNPGADVFIAEVEPEKELCYVGEGVPYDIRNHNPLEEWKKMMVAGGLEYVSCEWYFQYGGTELYLVRSRKPA